MKIKERTPENSNNPARGGAEFLRITGVCPWKDSFRIARGSGLIRRCKLQSALHGGATQGFLALFRYTRPNLAHVEPAAHFVIGLGLTSIPPNSRAGTADLTR
jgi:hypothetical protein